MGVPSLDNEFMEYWSKLTIVEKESLLSVAKNYVHLKEEVMPVSIEQYNKELDEAMERESKGEGTTLDELENEMKSW
jgi:hypothetical protein